MAQALRRKPPAPADAPAAPQGLRILARWLIRAPRKPSGGARSHREASSRLDAQNHLDSLSDSEALLLPEVPGRSCKLKRNRRG